VKDPRNFMSKEKKVMSFSKLEGKKPDPRKVRRKKKGKRIPSRENSLHNPKERIKACRKRNPRRQKKRTVECFQKGVRQEGGSYIRLRGISQTTKRKGRFATGLYLESKIKKTVTRV